MLLFSRLKKNERDLLKVLDVLLEATERRKSLRRGRQFEDDPELAGLRLDIEVAVSKGTDILGRIFLFTCICLLIDQLVQLTLKPDVASFSITVVEFVLQGTVLL